MKSPEERIQIIETSVSCFRQSLWGLIPIVGIVPSIVALVSHRRANRIAGGEWNPAKPQLVWGLVIAWIGLLKNTIAIAVILIFMFAGFH